MKLSTATSRCHPRGLGPARLGVVVKPKFSGVRRPEGDTKRASNMSTQSSRRTERSTGPARCARTSHERREPLIEVLESRRAAAGLPAAARWAPRCTPGVAARTNAVQEHGHGRRPIPVPATRGKPNVSVVEDRRLVPAEPVLGLAAGPTRADVLVSFVPTVRRTSSGRVRGRAGRPARAARPGRCPAWEEPSEDVVHTPRASVTGRPTPGGTSRTGGGGPRPPVRPTSWSSTSWTRSSSSVSSKKRKARIWPLARRRSTRAARRRRRARASCRLPSSLGSKGCPSGGPDSPRQNRTRSPGKIRIRRRAGAASRVLHPTPPGTARSASNSTAASETSRRFISGSRSSSCTRSKRPSTPCCQRL